MANYYWERYNAVPQYSYSLTQGPERFGKNGTAFTTNILDPGYTPFINTEMYVYKSAARAVLNLGEAHNQYLQLYADAAASSGGITLSNPIDERMAVPSYGLSKKVYIKYTTTGEVLVCAPVFKPSSGGGGSLGESKLHMFGLSHTSNITGYFRGAHVATIQADQNAYVNDARNVDGYWYVRGAKVNTAPNYTQIPAQSTKKNEVVTINLANYFSDPQGDVLTYAVSSSNPSIATATVAGSMLTLTGKEIGSAWITIDAKDGEYTTSQSFVLNVTNTAPTVLVSSPSANMTLYENDLLNIAGSASDVNANQSVTIYAQINLEPRIVLGVGLSNAPIPFNKQLKFKGGKMYDGDKVITGSLIDGVPHTLKIYAVDGDGGQSATTERTFYVVPNRPPVLTVDTVQPDGIVNTDKFMISGGASDPDGNTVTAAYRINGGNSVGLQINDGKWAFDITLAQLELGQNSIVVELTDSYNFKVSKTIKLNKEEVKTPILQSVARYKIEPPKGSAKGVLLWIQRDEDLDLAVELSMTLQGEQESYKTLTVTNTAPVSVGTVEDEFYIEADEAKNNIILKLSTSRTDINIDHKIHLISGVLE